MYRNSLGILNDQPLLINFIKKKKIKYQLHICSLTFAGG